MTLAKLAHAGLLLVATFAASVGTTGCYKRGPMNASVSPGMSAEMAMAGGYSYAEDLDASAFNTEDYNHIHENDFVAVADEPLSTFSVDVDTGSYSNMRRFLNYGQLPPADAVRIEELVNYFEYDYAEPQGPHPFSVTAEVGDCPWNVEHQLVHVGIQGKHIELDQVPPRNLVFLVDVSGSMSSPDKLGLLKTGLMMLADQLRADDRVSIVVYAGASGVVLEPTNDKQQIKRALSSLEAGGSTAGAEGLELAYAVADKTFRKGAVNRVILASDGDFNVGPSSQGELVRMIEDKRRSGVFLSVLGFGTGNLNDAMMEQIADKGNGNYAYIDSEKEAHRVLVEQANATLVPIAKDVKLQVEFNPAQVEAYRLIGYENRKLENEDFNDDQKDAGEIGAGHTVTALYEIVPAGSNEAAPKVDALKYQEEGAPSAEAGSGESMNVKIRYKQPDGDQSTLIEFPIADAPKKVAATSDNFRFSAAVAAFGMLLRGSKHAGSADFDQARELAKGAMGQDQDGTRREFMSLLDAAADLARQG